MAFAIRGNGETGREFDERIRAIESLDDETAAAKIAELLDWVCADAKVRRNLNLQRYEKILDYLDLAPNHPVWRSVNTMIRIRKLQNSVGRKREIQQRREAERNQL
jgi:hypothetical protein